MMKKESPSSSLELERGSADSMVVNEYHKETTTSMTTDSSTKKQLVQLNTLRQEMRERLADLLQVRSAGNPRGPKAALTHAANTIEALLFRSIKGHDGERFYQELLQNHDAIQSTLKELGTGILLQKLQKKQTKLGFRSKMVLKGIVTIGTKTKSDEKGCDVLVKAYHVTSTTRKEEGASSGSSTTSSTTTSSTR